MALWPAALCAAQTGRTHGRTNQRCRGAQKTLANGGPSTHGPVLASAFVASVADPAIFKSGRDLAAWIGLVPRQNSSGGKERLGGITKAGNGYLRQMLMVGAIAVIRYPQRNSARRPWLVQLMGRRPAKVAAIALANKTARTVWALMSSGERYRDPQAIQAAVSATL